MTSTLAPSHYQRVKDLLPLVKPRHLPMDAYGYSRLERIEGPFTGRGMYRGKELYCVGYSWSRPTSHHASGLVYDRVLGRGATFDAAIEAMRRKLTGQAGK